MASTHTASTLVASGSNAAAATTTSSSLDLSTAYGAIITAQITNGATGPTVACTVTVNIAATSTGTWYQWAQASAGVAASTAYAFSWEIPPPGMFVQIVFSGNTGQSVTVAAQAQVLTTV